MSDYFSDFMETAKKLADKVTNKTQETVEAAKLEIELRKAQTALDKEYKALGQIEFHIESGSMNRDENVVGAAVGRIQAAIERIAELQQKKEAGKAEPEEKKVEEPAEEEPAPEKNSDGYFVLKFCPNCKVGNHPDAKKCVNCGTPFEEEAEETEESAIDTTAETQSEEE